MASDSENRVRGSVGILCTSQNSVMAKFAQRVVPRESGKLERPWECTGGYSSSSTNSSRGTPYALAIFVTVGI
jgi:hypothetical protein